MAKLIWVVRDSRGRECTVRHEASTVQESREALEKQGYTDLTLKLDDIADAAQGVIGGHADKVSPEVLVRLTFDQSWRERLAGIRTIRTVAPVAGTLTLLGAVDVFQWQAGMWAWYAAATALFAGYVYLANLRLDVYRRIQSAKVWARWDEALRLLRTFQLLGWVPGMPRMTFEVVRTRAQALAFQGKVEDGVALFERYRNDPKVPRFLFESMLATVYDSANDNERTLACLRAAHASNPSNASLALDLAVALARFGAAIEESRGILAKVDEPNLPQFAGPWLPFCRGLIALREGSAELAISEFEKAEDGFMGQIDLSPLMVGLVLMVRCYLCVAVGRAGQTDRSRRLLGEVETILIARRLTDLLSDCRAAAGVEPQ